MANEELQAKLNKMTEKAITDLNKELHPTKLGEMLKLERPILKLVAISKYEGYGLALKELEQIHQIWKF